MKSILFFFVFSLALDLCGQTLPPNAILKNFKTFSTPRTNGRPGEVYRVDKDGTKFTVQDITNIKHKVSEEGNLIGRMYFTADEMLTFLNLEFDRISVIPAEVKIVNTLREYTEQTAVDKVLYENQKIREIIVDKESEYFLIRETISTKDITFKFSYDIVKRIKRGKSGLTEIKSSTELDYPFEIRKKFKKPKRIFYLEQKINIEPYED
ncbi:MAG: hypothetical protein V3V16_12325 [Melioribacteraceae bacterium]